MSRRFTMLWLSAMLSGSPGTDRPARAQDGAELLAPDPARMPGKVIIRVSHRELDRWVFASDGDADSARMLSESRLRSRINDIDHLCGLNPDQRKKLEAAGRGDIKRFFDRVESKRESLCIAEGLPADELRQGMIEVRKLGDEYRVFPFDDRSMFGKVLGLALDREQAERYRRGRDDDRLSRHQSRLRWVAQTLQKDLSLSDDQRVRFLCVLLEETRPPRRFGPSDYYGIMYQASRLPEARLSPIFAEVEWRAIRREFEDARRQEGALEESGSLPDGDDRPARDAPRGGRELGESRDHAVRSRPADDHGTMTTDKQAR
jgi:hypothetical protein